MSKYNGLFTFDTGNHKYVTVLAADEIIMPMDYEPPEPVRPLIKDDIILKKVDEYHKTKSITIACEIADDLYKLYN